MSEASRSGAERRIRLSGIRLEENVSAASRSGTEWRMIAIGKEERTRPEGE